MAENCGIGFIGAGRVGMSFARLLSEKNMAVEGFFSHRKEEDINFFESARELVEKCGIVFVTVSDLEIAKVWQEIRPYADGKTICHMSGALRADVFEGAERRASLHPMMAVPDKRSERKLENAFYCAEGTAADELKELFPFLKIKTIAPQVKEKYHAAAAMASNLVISLIDMSVKELEKCGFEREEALCAIENMVKTNAASVFEKGIEKSLTGPLERADAETVRKHLSQLKGCERRAYIALSENLIETAERKNPSRDYECVRKLLKG